MMRLTHGTQPVNAAVAAANLRLKERRAACSAALHAGHGQGGKRQQPTRLAPLVGHGQMLLAKRRGLQQSDTSTTRTEAWLTPLRSAVQTPFPCVQEKEGAEPSQCPNDKKEIKLYPSIAIGFLKQERSAEGRIWLLCRYLDEAGRGWLPVSLLQAQLTSKASPLRACGARQLRKLLQRGAGDFWQRDDDGRLWLRSAEFVAARLRVEKLAGRPIMLPIEHLLNIQTARAHFYASFFSGRKSDNPISREQLEKATGVKARTQPFYEKIAGVEVQRCIAIGEAYSEKQFKETLWQRRGNGFVFTDTHGNQGAAFTRYIAWHLPNRYTGQHPPAQFGRQRKINRQLRSSNTLVDIRARGNGAESGTDTSVGKTRVFYESGLLAATQKAKQSGDQYLSNALGASKNSAELWLCL